MARHSTQHLKKRTRTEGVIVGESPQIRKVLSLARRIANSASVTTLIIGESGTGKELVARLIHNLSASESQPFVDINCGAIPEPLLESELFGHEKGAFTGAHSLKLGLFELANSGTIFLDEVGNTTPSFQMKLLKAVEDKRFRRVSGTEEIQVSTRIIAATNIDLREAVREGHFREDLYYRLNVCPIFVPPLRERGEDVVILAEHFLELCRAEYRRDVKGLAPSALKLIRAYSWPGNVRQLKNAIERAVLVECDDWIEAGHLFLDEPGSHRQTPASTPAPAQSSCPDVSRIHIPDEGVALEDLEREIIVAALEKSHGNLSSAARLLHIKRGKLRYRLRRLGVSNRDIHELKGRTLVEY